jgi:hypothetical protein
MTPAQRHAIEGWFVSRGVPQFIANYGTEQSMDARAAPLITGWLVLWSALFWFSRPETPLPWSLAAIAGSLVFVVVADATIDAIRGRSPWRLPPRFDLVDIATFATLPVVPTLAVQRDPIGVVFSVLNVLLGIGVIYIVIGFGLLDIAGWALRVLRSQLGHIATLVSRTLPMLLILVVFLLFAAELWEAAHTLSVGELAAVLAILLLVAGVLIVSTFRPEIRRLHVGLDWETIRAEAADTPAGSLAEGPAPDGFSVPGLTWLQRRNVEFIVLINQLLQSTFVAVLVLGFLVAFGLIVVPASVQATWIGAPVIELVRLDLLGEARVLSAELIAVSTLLSGIVGLYFTGLALTDATYRADHVTKVVGELRTLLAARALYLAALPPEAIEGEVADQREPQPEQEAGTDSEHGSVRR